MPLIDCPECGHEVSDRAEACQNCGFPVQEINTNDLNEEPSVESDDEEEKHQKTGIDESSDQTDSGNYFEFDSEDTPDLKESGLNQRNKTTTNTPGSSFL